jgi:hypothetical protein
MANVDRPNGFTPCGHKNGGVVRAAEFKIAYNYATALFSGDAVILASGYVNVAADDSAAILGVFAGCQYKNDAGEVIFSPYWPGVALSDTAADVKAFVYADPGILFEVQSDTGTGSTIANIGASYDIEKDHSGSTLTGRSGQELDLGDTGTGQFTVYGLSQTPNNAFGVNSKLIVFNNVPVMG